VFFQGDVASGTSADGGVIMYNSVDVGGSLKVGCGLEVSTVDVLSELAKKQDVLGGDSVVLVSRLTTMNEVVTNTIRAHTASALTCDDNLAVTGSLTVGGVNIVQAFTTMEPAFEVESPLDKDYNFNTGVTTLRVDTPGFLGSPYYVAGKVNGGASVLVSRGRVAFTATLVSAGNYRIDFASPHPSGVH
jgi:hypothetical protein